MLRTGRPGLSAAQKQELWMIVEFDAGGVINNSYPACIERPEFNATTNLVSLGLAALRLQPPNNQSDTIG